MELRPAFPADTVGGSCFITGKYDASEGVVDLNVDLETLPPHGRLCIHPVVVRAMADLLGWKIVDPAAHADRVAELDRENAELRQLLDQARNALSDVLRAQDVLDELGVGQ